MTTTTPNEYRGVHVGLGQLRQVTVTSRETWKAIQATLGVRAFDVVGCDHGIDLYVDDEGAINGSPFNLPLTIISHTLGSPAALFGEGLALNCDNEGNTRGLTDQQVQAITDAIETKPAPAVIDAVIRTIDVHPAFAPIVALLKAL